MKDEYVIIEIQDGHVEFELFRKINNTLRRISKVKIGGKGKTSVAYWNVDKIKILEKEGKLIIKRIKKKEKEAKEIVVSDIKDVFVL